METLNVQDFFLSAGALSSSTLDLSKKGITKLPEDMPRCRKLECLYLEGNRLSHLPESLFSSCPNLRWLDLRNNKLTSLPPAIEQLKYLRTLLLEGNQFTHLPTQLGTLPHLTGLNISRNPLEDPPREVINKGTKAVLNYLRKVSGEDWKEMASSEDSEPSLDSTYIPTRPSLYPGKDHFNAQVLLPLPLMKQVTLYTQGAVRRGHQLVRPDSPISPPPRSNRRKKTLKTVSKLTMIREPPPPPPPAAMSMEEKAKINSTLDRLKSRQELEEWRNKAKMQKELKAESTENQDLHPKAVDTAPFATDSSKDSLKTPSSTFQEGRLAESDVGQGSLREARAAAEVEDRVQMYLNRLEERRKQAGLISTPSTDLVQAERSLARAMALQVDIERKKRVKEYRLTAFTGD